MEKWAQRVLKVRACRGARWVPGSHASPWRPQETLRSLEGGLLHLAVSLDHVCPGIHQN